jgi:hypothetical protein
MSTQGAVASVAAAPAGDTEALVERLFGAASDMLDVASVRIGDRLGLYRALAAAGR